MSYKDVHGHTIGCTQDPQNCHGMCSCDCHFGDTIKDSSEEDTKLIIFGWIVTMLKLEQDVASHQDTRRTVNELVDKIYEVTRV